MWRLPLPDSAAALDHVRTALTQTRGGALYRLTAPMLARVANLYQRYDNARGEPHPDFYAGGLTAALNEAIATAYDQVQKGKRLAHLREVLLSATYKCPACGISPVTDLDHHLPQAIYPPLSIYSRNLVPYCHTCNNKKRAVGENERERFAHPYFIDCPDEVFFTAECRMTGRALVTSFAINRIAGMSRELHAKLTYQFGRLELADRYQAEMNVFLSSHQISISDAYGADRNPARVADWARRSADALAEKWGKNDWHCTLLRGIAACNEFCDGGFEAALGMR